VPNQPANPTHSVRVPDELWVAARRVADDRGETLADVIRAALERYVREHPSD
jgi:predicted DNA-binding protein